MIAQRLTEVRSEQKQTITERCELAAELSKGKKHTVYWTNFNSEADLIEQLDKDATQIDGSMSIEKKEDILLAFYNKEIKNLITKPKITAFGLNWQHCNHTVFFPTFSYEQYYQAIRRFWRFGQTKPVTVDIVYSDGQKRVLDSLLAKTKKADELFGKLNAEVNQSYTPTTKGFDKQIILPKFL
jgi:SNF2 family DNA or RNA helicase